MTEDGTVREKVIKYTRDTQDIVIGMMTHLSPRAVAVHDNSNEIDVYFIENSYDITYKKVWETKNRGSTLFPPGLEGTGLGVLPGVGRVPAINSFEEALQFAKEQLTPKGEAAQ